MLTRLVFLNPWWNCASVIEKNNIYVQLEKNAFLFRPKLIVAGSSAYARHYDYTGMSKVGFNLLVTINSTVFFSICKRQD